MTTSLVITAKSNTTSGSVSRPTPRGGLGLGRKSHAHNTHIQKNLTQVSDRAGMNFAAATTAECSKRESCASCRTEGR